MIFVFCFNCVLYLVVARVCPFKGNLTAYNTGFRYIPSAAYLSDGFGQFLQKFRTKIN